LILAGKLGQSYPKCWKRVAQNGPLMGVAWQAVSSDLINGQNTRAIERFWWMFYLKGLVNLLFTLNSVFKGCPIIYYQVVLRTHELVEQQMNEKVFHISA
jgi:hypothetical protein